MPGELNVKKFERQKRLVEKYRERASGLQARVEARRAESPEAKMKGVTRRIGRLGRKIARKVNKYGEM